MLTRLKIRSGLDLLDWKNGEFPILGFSTVSSRWDIPQPFTDRQFPRQVCHIERNSEFSVATKPAVGFWCKEVTNGMLCTGKGE